MVWQGKPALIAVRRVRGPNGVESSGVADGKPGSEKALQSSFSQSNYGESANSAEVAQTRLSSRRS
jgi:hypothetical protein